MRKLLLVSTAAALLAAAPSAASPKIRLAIVHYLRGCHVWSRASVVGPTARLTMTHGTKLVIRVSCPMDFDFFQTAGPPLDLGDRRTHAGTTRTIVFRKPGLYKLVAKNVQSSEEQGLQTLGPDNTLTLAVRVS